MTNLLFSTYTQGENRVTSTFLAVCEHINSALLEEILETILDESDLHLITFANQVNAADSVPDAVIRSSTTIWFETKTVPNAVDRDQLERHLSARVHRRGIDVHSRSLTCRVPCLTRLLTFKPLRILT